MSKSSITRTTVAALACGIAVTAAAGTAAAEPLPLTPATATAGGPVDTDAIPNLGSALVDVLFAAWTAPASGAPASGDAVFGPVSSLLPQTCWTASGEGFCGSVVDELPSALFQSLSR